MDFSSYTSDDLEQIAKAMKIQEQKMSSISQTPTTFDEPEDMDRSIMIDKHIFHKIMTLRCGKGWFRYICRQDRLTNEYSKLHFALPDTPKITFEGVNGGIKSFHVPSEEQIEKLLKRYGNKEGKHYDSTIVKNIEIAKINLKWLKQNQYVPQDKQKIEHYDVDSFSWGDQSVDDSMTIKDDHHKMSSTKMIDIHEFENLKDTVASLKNKIDQLQSKNEEFNSIIQTLLSKTTQETSE